jgi:hypothetical protein
MQSMTSVESSEASRYIPCLKETVTYSSPEEKDSQALSDSSTFPYQGQWLPLPLITISSAAVCFKDEKVAFASARTFCSGSATVSPVGKPTASGGAAQRRACKKNSLDNGGIRRETQVHFCDESTKRRCSYQRTWQEGK